MNHEDLSRVIKIAIDSGEVSTVEEAEDLFAGYRLAISVGPEIENSPTLQAALLTAVNTARRCFLGGVFVSGNVDVDLLVPWRRYRTLQDAVVDLDGQLDPGLYLESIPLIGLGSLSAPACGTFAVQATFNGWCAGVVPFGAQRLPESQECTPAGVVAGALAVSEAFQHVRGDNVMAGRRAVGMSLWDPSPNTSWWECDGGPVLEVLPSRLWLIGLGHLGQAYLWTLGLLPYARPEDVILMLQDTDILSKANDSTSPLTFKENIGEKKTRAMARWCEERGFNTAITERRFDASLRIRLDEPRVGVCGVDNAEARAVLEQVDFARVIEAGLGHGSEGYRCLQIHAFPASRGAAARWSGTNTTGKSGRDASMQPAYRQLANDGLDACGITLLAGRTVGASFVGTVTAALVVAQLVKLAMGLDPVEVIDMDLRNPQMRIVVERSSPLAPFNPGYTRGAP